MSNRGRHKKPFQHLIVQILGQKIADRMMQCQKEQGNVPNLDVFLRNPMEGKPGGGFTWRLTKEGHEYWDVLLTDRLLNHYFYQNQKNDRR